MVDSQPMEVELKLAATSEAMDTLIASPLLRGHARSSLRSRQLVTTYYDTDDHRLSRRQLALRVRQTGRKFVQTLKTASDGQGAETARGEWEVELPDGNAAADRLQRSGRARPHRPGPARRAAADLRDALSPPGHAGRVARRQPAAGPDRDRVRSRRHPRRRRRGADLRDRAGAQARRARAPCSSSPSRCGRWRRCACSRSTRRRAATGWSPARRRPGARRAPSQLRGDHDGRGRAADHPGRLRAALDGERGRHRATRATRRACTSSAWHCAGCARR